MTRRALTRREALRLGAGAALLGLAGCGSDDGPLAGPHSDAVARTSIAIDYASYYAPVQDLKRLVQSRAHARGVTVLFSSDPSGSPAQLTSLRGLTGARGGFGVVVVAPFDAAAVDPIAQAALDRKVRIVSFIMPLAHQTAAIGVDGPGAARLLAEHAATAAKTAASRRVLLVAPPAASPVPDPFFPAARRAAAALATAAPAAGLTVAATVTALGTPDAAQVVGAALAQHPGVRTVLTWNDATALGAAQAVPRAGYVGALGAPAVTTAAVLRAIDGDGPLRCVVAPRLAALADALVDLPRTLLRGGPAQSVLVPAQVLGRGTAAARAARADYA